MKISAAKSLLSAIFQYNLDQAASGAGEHTYLVPFFIGDPGVGKTAIPRQVAREMSASLGVDIGYYQAIIAQYDAGEMAGLPMMDKEHENMIRLRPNYLPPLNAADDVSSYNIGIFNLDELPQAFLANQNIASQMVNEWRVGEHQISPAITICCTGNKPENKAGTTTMPTHLRDRLMFIEIEADTDDWLDYAAQRSISPLIRSYIRQNPGKLMKFDVGTNANPTPRSWEKCNAILKMQLRTDIRKAALGGQVGDGAATEFEAYLRIEDRLPKLEDILADPEKAPVFTNKDADILYLLTANLADIADKKNIGKILKYINRIPAQEFSLFFITDLTKRDPSMRDTNEIIDWKMNKGKDLMF